MYPSNIIITNVQEKSATIKKNILKVVYKVLFEQHSVGVVPGPNDSPGGAVIQPLTKDVARKQWVMVTG